jgi:hypothetical protein
VQAIVESGAVVLPAHAPWLDDWLDEVCAFSADGSAAHDDQVDSMVWALRDLAYREVDDTVGAAPVLLRIERSAPADREASHDERRSVFDQYRRRGPRILGGW